ncbi:Tc toxin subunit A [Trinickia mobilis]|uniref:Tc toxin subunit A n=1 Tax=Trinickia mobilis TaxID=2816356 RepID=UPI001A8C0F24|nr:Tc toxin subunit A [Trinickia mobilis]
MNDSVVPLEAPCLIDQVTGDREMSWLLHEAGLNSVFDIAKLSAEQFVARHGVQLNGNGAAMHERATSYANQLLQAARAIRMGQRQRTPFPEGGGIPDAYLAVGGPTYQRQFKEPWFDLCAPRAIEAADSPVAYLADLYRLAAELERSAGAGALKLATRRPDIGQLVLDVDSTYKVVPTLSLVNEVLEAAIAPTLGGQALDEVLATSRYPFNLPFDLWNSQINLALQAQHTDLGEVIAQADLKAPYFTRVPDDPTELTGLQTRSLLASSGLSEEACALISGPMPASDDEAMAFLRRHYGVSEQVTTLPEMISQLSQVSSFLKATGLSGEELDHLFAQGEFRAIRSTSVPSAMIVPESSGAGPEPMSDPHNYYGVRYIHGASADKVYLHTANGFIQGLDMERLWRINAFVRLQRWSGLPFDRLDHLIAHAENAGVPRLRLLQQRAVGLYRRWHARYQIVPDVAISLLRTGDINVNAIGNQTPQCDLLFGARPGVSEALVLDFGTFDPDDPDDPTVQKICAGLQITSEEWRLIISRGWGGNCEIFVC